MPKRNEKSYAAEKLFLNGMKLVEIASQLNIPEGTVRRWKSTYGWGSERSDKKSSERSDKKKRKRGGQPGNKNATGPPENQNARKHGLFSKYLPPDIMAIIEDMPLDPLEMLWDQIQLAYAAILRSQQIMYVEDKDDKTKETTGSFENGDTYEFQQAWDKQANFMKAQSRTQAELRNLIKQYEEMLHKNWKLATAEQKARIRKLKAEIGKLQPEAKDETTEYKGIPASMIAPPFASVLFDIREQMHREYVFPGGRGSTKSSFISLAIVDILMSMQDMHAVIMRQVADTMRGSVYMQMMWAIEALGLSDVWRGTVSPMEITNINTGQKIYFRGGDDPGKVKSIKVPFGYIGVLWLEELDQFVGPESVRKIEQSAIRGGDVAYILKSFNPPKSASNWANKYIKVPKESRLVTFSNYLEVPPRWLGKPFIEEAEFLKSVNPTAYENEYMGEANGTGGAVFDNVTIREITDAEIAQFDRIHNGVDWGWYPDPYHFGRMHYDAARMTLFIFVEYRARKKSNKETADKLFEKGITGNDLIICDSAEKKSVGDYRSYGLMARGAEKGPGSVEYSMKWLQSLREIVIDNTRCPHTAAEFLDYEYDRDKEGEVISGYPDKNNHAIDMVRYAMNPVWKRRGK